MAGITEDQGPRPPPLLPSVGCMKKKIPSRPHGLTSRLVSSQRPRGGGDTRQARRRRAEPGTPSRDPAGRRPAPRPTLPPCAAVLRSFRRTATAAAPRRLAPRPRGSRRPVLPCFPVRFPPPPWLVAGPLSQFPKVCQAISPKISNPNQ